MSLRILRYNGSSGWLIAVLFVVVLVGTPIVTIAWRLLDGPGDNWAHLSEFLLPQYIFNSLFLVTGTSVLTLLMGVPTAWWVSTREFPGRKHFEWVLILPLSIPTYIMAFTYAGIFDYAGPLQSFSRNVLNQPAGHGFIDILNIYGVMVIMALVLYPYVYVVARASFLQSSRSLIESSQTLGASSFRTFFKVVIPVARPALVAGLLLVVMEVLNDYGAVKYFGVATFTTGIFRAWFSLEDVHAAIYLSALLLSLIFGLIALERWQRGRAQYHATSVERPFDRKQLSRGRGWLLFLACLIPCLFGFIVPVLQLGQWALMTKKIDPSFLVLTGNTFLVAVVAALLCVVAALLLTYSNRLYRSLSLKVLTRVATLGYAIPGAVVAVGIMIPLLAFDRQLISWARNIFQTDIKLLLTGTLICLVLAYVVRFLTVAYNPLQSGYKKIGQHLDEASRSLGMPPWKTLIKINMPLLKTTLFSAGLLVFVDILKELPLTLILRPFNFHTLATKAFELASDELVAQAAWPSLVIIGVGLIPVYLISNLSIKN